MKRDPSHRTGTILIESAIAAAIFHRIDALGALALVLALVNLLAVVRRRRHRLFAAAENPLNKRFSMVIIAGLGGASTLRTAPRLAARLAQPAEVLVLPHGGSTRALVLPAKDLVYDVKEIVMQK